MGRCTNKGYIDTRASNNRALRIIYIHDDNRRSADRLNLEVAVLKEFAAAYNRGEPDVRGKIPLGKLGPVDIILVNSSMHPSTSDNRPHISVEATTNDLWGQEHRPSMTGLHVYSSNNSLSQGFESFWHQGKNFTKHQSAKIKADIQQALSNNFKEKSPAPARHSASPSSSQQQRAPSPPKQPQLAGYTNGYSVYSYQGGYYYLGADGTSQPCGPPAQPVAQPSSSRTPSQPGPSVSSSSGSKTQPKVEGYVLVGGRQRPYYWSERQQMFWYTGDDGQKHRYIPKDPFEFP